MKPELVIRTDASHQIGLGHIVRCSALADMLKDNFQISFIFREIPDTMLIELKTNGFSCSIIGEETEFIRRLAPNIIVVLDGYHFNTGYQKQIKATGTKLVCIDDLHDKEFFADLIINHTPGIHAEDYKSQPYTKFALGLEYALLRPLFLEQAKQPRNIDKVETVLICFGGSDPKNLTESVLKVVITFIHFKKIIVVTGGAYLITNSLVQLVTRDTRIDHRHALNEKQLLHTMLESELAIVPASGILFEVLAVGCIVITGSYINNQSYILKGFSNLKAVEVSANLSNPRSAIKRVFNGTYSSRKSLIDGESKNRTNNKIKALID